MYNPGDVIQRATEKNKNMYRKSDFKGLIIRVSNLLSNLAQRTGAGVDLNLQYLAVGRFYRACLEKGAW